MVRSKISTWHAWGEMKGVSYDRNTSGEQKKGQQDVSESKPVGKPRNPGASGEISGSDGKPRSLRYTHPYMRGDDVKSLQESLNAIGYDCGKIDGIFGKKTQSVVKAFQAAHGLIVDGIVGKNTREALQKVMERSDVNQ